MRALRKLRRWAGCVGSVFDETIGDAILSSPWRRIDFYTVAYYPALARCPYAKATLLGDGKWRVEYPGLDPDDVTEGDEEATLPAAMSRIESAWTEHRRSLQHVDGIIEDANRRV